jgi:ABC-type multidrug transport system ATPase subunit
VSAVLTIERLRRWFGDHVVITELDLELEAGGRIALRGPNGSGKSTVLRCVTGTLMPSAGSVTVAGYEAGSVQARRMTGVSLSQERSFYLRLSGRENLVFFARLRGYSLRDARRVVAELEQELELGGFIDQRADRYSTGMILQLALARALLGEPSLLLLDEPTRSLDSGAVERLWDAIDRRPETALLIATHREDDLERCDSSIALPR